jgi:hypothetical protein
MNGYDRTSYVETVDEVERTFDFECLFRTRDSRDPIGRVSFTSLCIVSFLSVSDIALRAKEREGDLPRALTG